MHHVFLPQYLGNISVFASDWLGAVFVRARNDGSYSRTYLYRMYRGA